ncbi:MAG: hypothetical protein WCC17_07570 [Candidatus Nitrosopolaris sp.]
MRKALVLGRGRKKNYLILPGVNIIGSGDSVAIPCRWTMGTECYHTFPAFSLAKATPTISVFHLFPNSLI